MSSWLSDLLIDTSELWANSIMEYVFGMLNSLFAKAETVVNLKEINNAAFAINTVASSFIILLMMKQILSIYILEMDGDAEQDPFKILEKGCVALAIIQMQNFFLKNLIKMAESISNYVLNAMTIQFDNLDEVINIIGDLAFGVGPIIGVILIISYTVGFCMFLWKALKRSGELAIMKILFPIFACDIVTVSMERFRAFTTSYLVTIFGYIVQMILFKLSLLKILGGDRDYWLSLIFIIMASSAPKWIEKYIYSTGASKAVINSVKSAAHMIPQMIRMGK